MLRVAPSPTGPMHIGRVVCQVWISKAVAVKDKTKCLCFELRIQIQFVKWMVQGGVHN